MTQPTVEITIEVGGPTVTIATAGAQGPPGPAGADGAPGVVQSVNGHSAADITLTATDVQALPLTGGTVTGTLTLDGALQIPTGAQAGYAWTSDVDGVGSWQPGGSGGGVQIGGDLGGTNTVPLVQSTHLAAPLPLAQGGTGAADAAGARTALGLGTAATADTTAFDAAGAAAAAQAAAISTAEGSAASLYVPLAGLTGPLSFGGFKATDLADGTAATDAATFGQIPVIGTTAGTVAAGDDTRITGAAQKAQNLADLANASAARGNLGLGTMAQQNAGTAVGVLAEMLPMHQCSVSGGSSLTGGVLILNLIRPLGPILVTNLVIWLTVAGVTANGANGLALYSEAGTLIDQTGDLSTVFTATGVLSAPLASGPQQLAADTSYYVAVLTHYSGTTPRAAAALAGSALPVANGRYLSLTKTSTASFPASFTPSSLTISTAAYYMAMS